MKKVVTPASLKWLITKKARISGEINNIETMLPIWLPESKANLAAAERKVAALRENYNKNLFLQKKLPQLKTQLKAIEVALTLHDVQINQQLITPVRTNKKKLCGPYGSLTRGIYECLKMSDKPATTKEVTSFVINKNRLDINKIDFIEVQAAVGKRLGTLAQQGKIERLHALIGAEEGIWKLPS